jgi:hypothetical protein
MRAIGSQIFGHDLKREGVSSGSNLGCRSMNGRWRSALARPTVARQGKPSGAIAERAARRSTAPKLLWCTKCDRENGKIERGSRGCPPRAANDSVDGGCGSRWQGGSSELGWRRWLNVGVLQLQEEDGSFTKMSSSSSWLQLRRAVTEDGTRQRRLVQRRWVSLGPKYARYRALFIGVFG